MDKKSPLQTSFEFYALCGLALSLPLIEVTKHIFSLLLLALLIYRIAKERIWLPPSPAAKYIIIFLVGSIIASIGASANGYEVKKLHDIIRYGLIGLIILYIPLSTKQTYIVLACLVISAIVGIGDAYYSVFTGAEKSFELRSVGHINHSSIYILLIAGISLGLTFNIRSIYPTAIAFLVANSIIIYGLLETNSRATFIGVGILFLLIIFFGFLKSKKTAFVISIFVVIIALTSIWYPPAALNKIYRKNAHYQNGLTPREKAWNTAYHAWKKEPAFGIGYGNYKIITLQKMQEWYDNSDTDFANKEYFVYLPHAHNRYVNTLAEGGIIGLLSLLSLFGGILLVHIKTLCFALHDKHVFSFWLIGSGTLASVTIVGLFNTTLHHEHGLLAMILFGLTLQQLTKNRPDKTIENTSNPTKSIVFITKGRQAPSFRHRLTPLISILESTGYLCRIETFDKSNYVWRIWKNKDIYQHADILVLHKPLLPTFETSLLCSLNKNLVLDIDDAIHLKEPKWVGHFRPISKSREAKFEHMIKKCKLTITGNNALESKVKLFTNNVRVLPTGIDRNTCIRKTNTKNSQICRVVWIGLPSNMRYLEMLHSRFALLTKNYPNFVLRIICSRFPDWQDVRLEKTEWSEDTEKQALVDSDIGIMPLDDSEYSKGKCAFKLLQYMSAGLPCIASPVGANCDVVTDGVNGFLVEDEDQWLEKLSLLIENPEMRKSMGEKGLDISVNDYQQKDIAEKYAQLITELVS
jgi:O-antigen ligase